MKQTHKFKIKTGGRFVRAVREYEGLSQVQLAKKLKISRSHMANIENGNRTIGTWPLFVKLCTILKMTPNSLVNAYIETKTDFTK